MRMPGRVSLVGAGPGDPELLTLKALRRIEEAEVIVYDRLVSQEILALANPNATLIAVGKEPRRHTVPQDEINRILVREALSGCLVVRLKGGDPFVFGRGSEEALALAAAGIGCDIVPGITAAQGCAASAGIPLTHRGIATGVRFITGHCREDSPLDFDWRGLADPLTTLVVYMGAGNIAFIAERLVSEGLPAATPVLAIDRGTLPGERRLATDLGHVAYEAERADFEGPVLFIIGAVAGLSGEAHVCPLLRHTVPLERAFAEAAAHA